MKAFQCDQCKDFVLDEPVVMRIWFLDKRDPKSNWEVFVEKDLCKTCHQLRLDYDKDPKDEET